MSFQVRLRYFSSLSTVAWLNNEIVGYFNSLDLQTRSAKVTIYLFLAENELETKKLLNNFKIKYFTDRKNASIVIK